MALDLADSKHQFAFIVCELGILFLHLCVLNYTQPLQAFTPVLTWLLDWLMIGRTGIFS